MCTFFSERVRLAQASVVWLALMCGTCAHAGAAAGDWPNYRGPENNGMTSDKSLNVAAVTNTLKPRWKASVGQGYSGITVSGGKVFTMGNDGKEDTVWCLDANTGQVVWKHTYACGTASDFPGPRAAPVTDGTRVYTLSRKGHLFCLDAAKGTVVWQAEAKSLGASNPAWDLSGSPLLYGNMLIYNLNTSGVALDKASGKVVWKSAGGAPGYATPVPFDINGMKGVCIFGSNMVYGINPADGKVGWSFPWQAAHNVAAVDPVFQGDKVFISTGYGAGCAGLQIAGGQAKKLWQNKEVSAHISNCVGQGGVVYAIDGQNGGDKMKCIDPATGEVKWTQQGAGGTAIMVDGKMVILSPGGKLTVAEVTPAGFKELATASVLNGTCWTQPSFAGGNLFARNKEGDLVCLNLSGK